MWNIQLCLVIYPISILLTLLVFLFQRPTKRSSRSNCNLVLSSRFLSRWSWLADWHEGSWWLQLASVSGQLCIHNWVERFRRDIINSIVYLARKAEKHFLTISPIACARRSPTPIVVWGEFGRIRQRYCWSVHCNFIKYVINKSHVISANSSDMLILMIFNDFL